MPGSWWAYPEEEVEDGRQALLFGEPVLHHRRDLRSCLRKCEEHLSGISSTARRVGVVRELPEQLDRERRPGRLAHKVVLVAGDREDGYGTTHCEAEKVADLGHAVEHLAKHDARRKSEVKGCLLADLNMVGAGTNAMAPRVEPDECALASGERNPDVVRCVKPDLDVREDEIVLSRVLLHADLAVEA